MISSKDRSGWFGASDTDFIIGNWETATFEKWWLTKLGIITSDFQNQYLLAGTHKEHQILNSLQIPLLEFDKQILIPELKLRVNLDGNTEKCIFECKTHSAEKPFKVPIKYKRQVWAQMYASGIRQAKIVSYGLTDEDYNNFFSPNYLLCSQRPTAKTQCRFIPQAEIEAEVQTFALEMSDKLGFAFILWRQLPRISDKNTRIQLS